MIMERKFGSSLFERIHEAANPSLYRRPKAEMVCSLRDNLRNVLNSRSGSCYGSPELGLSDFNDDSSDALNKQDTIVQSIKDCILRYEPRISNAEVSAVVKDAYAPLELRFRIVAGVNFNDIHDVLEFDILLDHHQHWRVE